MSTQSQRGRRVQTKKKNQTLVIFYWIIGALVIAGGAFLATVAIQGGFGTTSTPVTVEPINAPVGLTDEGFYYKGNPDAPVKVIEYSDFQCPACAAFVRSLSPIITQTYVDTGKIQFIYHEFPLDQHSNAVKSAEAARCAGDQNASSFWQMHDMLFTNQSEWASLTSPTNRFIAYAGQLGLDRSQFESCLAGGKYTAQVAAAKQSALSTNIPATPTFIVDGQQVNAAQLQAAIDAALTAKGQR